MRRIGIPIFIRGTNWLGGLNYFRSLVNALILNPRDDFEFYLITNAPSQFLSLMRKSNGNVRLVTVASKVSNSFLVRGVSALFSTNLIVDYYSRLYDLTMITHSVSGFCSGCKGAFWMPDFQHKHLPDLFSAREIMIRDNLIKAAYKRDNHIIVSSHSAAADFKVFYPHYEDMRCSVLQFAPIIELEHDNAVACRVNKSVIAGDDTQEYFYLPNQFWRHKNHAVVLEALKILPSHYRVICTGAMEDYRDPSYALGLLESAEKDGLSERFLCLGVVPREKQLELLKNAIAVINPSLFEGWSTTVEEAKYFGKRLILSDLTVHREQNPKDAIYFPPSSPSELAAAMVLVYNEFSLEREMLRYEWASTAYPKAICRFSSTYYEILNRALY